MHNQGIIIAISSIYLLPGGSGTMGRRLMPNTVTPGHTHVGRAVEKNYYKYVVHLVGYRKPYAIVGR